ncbi:MAG: cytochrome c [Marinagarivorans sp.]|nr:cytochrome c [Marinagarivorans sp.]
MKLILSTALTLGLSHLALSHSALAGDIAAGKTKAAMCAACHGLDGIGIMPTYPNLAGQHEAYLKLALHAYKKGERTGGQAAIMAAMAATLNDTDIDNVAAYYASLGAK